jgi:site-specific recombinase XerD
MSDKDSIMAEQAIREYLEWMASEGYRAKMLERNRWELEQFLLFIRRKGMPWDEMFTLDTLNAFRKEKNRKHVPALRELSRYLFDKQMISQPIQRRSYPLPEIYEDYLLSYERSREVHRSRITEVRRLLSAFHEFVEQAGITLPTIRIEHIDAFLAYFTLNLAPGTSRVYRSFLRGV